MCITCDPADHYLQSLLPKWLCKRVDYKCADWFQSNWTGPVKGTCWVQAVWVTARLVRNNQSLESGWWWQGISTHGVR